MWRVVLVVCGMVIVMAGAGTGARDDASAVHAQRVHEVRRVSGVAAFGDFVTREPGSGLFVAHTARPDEVAYPLDAVNYVRDYWQGSRGPPTENAWPFPVVGG